MALLSKAIRAGWPMSAKAKASILRQLNEVLKTKDKPRWVLMDEQKTAMAI